MTLHVFASSLQVAMHWAWTTSLIVALPALLLLVLGRVNRFPSMMRWMIGAALIVRLLLPSALELPGTKWMPSPKFGQHATAVAKNAPSAQHETLVRFESAPASVATAPGFSIVQALPCVWLAGVCLVGLWVVWSHRTIRRRIDRVAMPCEEEMLHQHLRWSARRMGIKAPPALLTMPDLPTVALSGWLRPRILVPAGLSARFSADEIRGIFLHELAHVKRHDVLWSWISLAACALHWFNPFVWLIARRFHADRELECDRLALKMLDAGQRQHFGEALLKTLEGQQWSASPALVSFAQRQTEIRTRILMIARPLSPLWIRCFSLLVAPALVLLTLNNASADGEKEPGKAREGEGAKKTGLRDGEGGQKTGARDGEGTKKTGARDGEGMRKTGARDGEGTKKVGARDGEGMRKPGARDGEGTKKVGARDGEGTKKTGARDGEGSKKAGAEGDKAVSGNAIIIRATEKGESVMVDGQKIDANHLRAHLSEFLPANPGRPVIIEADDDIPYKTVMEVLDAARDNGAKKAILHTTKG